MSVLEKLKKETSPTAKALFGIVAAPRLGGKCLKEGTLVHTLTGPKPIELVEPGERVFGFNSDGSITPTTVLARVDQGRKEVVDLLYSNKVVATATKEHRWWTIGKRGNARVGRTEELFTARKLGRRFVDHQGGEITNPAAYALGVLLGNGCCRQGSGRRFDLSSACEDMVAAVARLLGGTYKSNSALNYTWSISVPTTDVVPHYAEWCEGKYAHEKMVDLDVIRSWDRRSQIALLAGLFDTDGSVGVNPNQRSFTLSFSSTSASLASAVSYLILSLFQTKPSTRLGIREGKRDCWDVRISSGFHAARILREMDEFIRSPQKKFRVEYEDLPHQRNPERIKVTEGSTYEAHCWDLMVDNDTSLYLLTNEGLITHNTTLAGTLPGKTLLLQAQVFESGCESAKTLAARNKYQLDVVSFNSLDELNAVIAELKLDTSYDSVYVDGLSAITELKMREPRMIQLLKSDNWGAFRELGDVVTTVLLNLKELTYPNKTKKAKNTFVTCALRVEQKGTVTDVELETKGRVAVSAVTKLGEAVVTVLPPQPTENGMTGYRLLTKSDGVWPGRIDGILADNNAGIIEPADLSKVLAIRNGVSNGK